MSLSDELKDSVTATFKEAWSVREGIVVPEPKDLKLNNDAVHFDRATFLYADLTGSTQLVAKRDWQFSAEIYKAFLYCASRIIRNSGGTITSYDGDRVMGVFAGDQQTTPATKAALKINYAVQEIINPALRKQYSNVDYTVTQVVGIDTGECRAARTGVRGDNDIVWVGKAANNAAKLTEIKLTERTWITAAAYKQLDRDAKYGGESDTLMWKEYQWTQNNNAKVYGSAWRWKV